MKRVYLVAGESSGDMHGANLVRAMRELAPEAVCEGVGGPRMAAEGMTLHVDLASHAVMGFSEVVRSFSMIRRVFLDTLARIERDRPDAVVLIDYPGFNIRLAKRIHALGIPVIYYISPQVWAWKRKRLHTLARLVRKMLVILPFEEALYRGEGVDCAYVGHPLLDHVARTPVAERFKGQLVIGLLPGSREQEIRRLLEPMIATARRIQAAHPEARFVTPCVNAAREAQVRAIAGDFPLETVTGAMYDVLSAARCCMTASGTATLETALFGVPEVIVYRVSALSYWIAKKVVHIENIGIVNILAGRRIVPEFIQHEVGPDKLAPAMLELIEDTHARARMLEDLAALRVQLGEPGASMRAARHVLEVIEGGTGGLGHA